MRRFAIQILAALLAVVAAHRGILDLELGGADLARAAGVGTEIPDGPPGEIAERDASPALYALERRLFGASHRGYVAFGLALLVLAAALWGEAVRRLAIGAAPAARRLPLLDVGAVAAALFAGSAVHFDSLQSLAGHAWLLAALVFAALVAAGCRRPGFSTLALGPLAASLVFRETAGMAFLLAPLCVLAARPGALRAVGSRPGAAIVGAALLLGRALEPLFLEAPLGARDLGEDLAAPAALLRHLLALVVPVPPEQPGWGIYATSFGLAAGALALCAFVLARAGARRPTLVGLLLLALALALGLRGPALPAGLGDLRILGFAALGLSMVCALGWEALARRGPLEPLALGLVAFLLYSGGNAHGVQRAVRDAEVLHPEWREVTNQLADLPRDFARVWLLGLDPGARRIPWGRALRARLRSPWTDRPVDLVARDEDRYGDLPEGLLVSGGRTLLCEWRPRSVLAARSRPRNWVVAPVFSSPPEAPAEPAIRLVSPTGDARLPARRPERIEDDTTFVFETPAGFEMPEDAVFVFYSVYPGGNGPKGKTELSVRPLTPAVLLREELPDGGRRWRWRPSIRPEPGHDGILFEDGDLGLAGKPFTWTVGVAPVRERPRDAGQPLPPGHAGHVHDSDPASLRAPLRLAQTARVRFEIENNTVGVK